MLCEACGTANPAGNRFCDQCGAPLTSSCPACSEPNRGDARFCGACGTVLVPPGQALQGSASAAAGGQASERRLVTVLFVDLVGFTAFASGRDPERVRELQQGYFDRAAASIVHHGGTVEKFIGDAVMAVWGTPVAHEDDAQRAVRAALEVARAVEDLGHDLAARAGVVTGEAAVTVGAGNQAMVAGDMVNTASRLQSAASPGEVLADEATVSSAAGSIAFEPVDALTLKGKAEPMAAWRALRVVHGRTSDLVAPPFVGRASELRQLKEMLHGVGADRRLRLASITGPAGIGKSRLAEELQSYADGLAEAVWWHTGRSPSYGEGLAFWAVGEMVRRRAGLAEGDDEPTTRAKLAATLDDLVPDAAERGWVEPALLTLLGIGQATGTDTLFAAWRTFFERMADRGTTVLVFEDLQWADTGTLEFIEHLLDWSRSQPILVLTLARPELFDHRPGWGTGRSTASAMALEPMPEADMRELLRGLLPGLPDAPLRAIVDRAGGMPLYAVEVVRALLTEGRVRRAGDAFEPVGELGDLPVPASLRSLIASRLDALDADDRALLRDASVLGLSFTAAALAAVTGAGEAELELRLRGLVRRELLEIEADPRSPERGQYRFVQSLIREVAYDMLSLRDRRSRHLAAARQLEGVESDEAAGALASHYLAAFHASAEGPEADAVAAQARVSLRAAAERAAGLGAFSQAVRNLEHAVELTADPRARYELLERAAEFGRAAATEEGVRCARLAVDAAERLDDFAAAVRARVVLADALMDADEIVEAAGILEAAVAEVDARAEDIPEDALALLWAVTARGEMRTDRAEAAVVSADRALVIAERANLDLIAATALVNKGSALSQAGRPREGIALLSGAVQLAERIGAQHLELRAAVNLASTQSESDLPSALETVDGALQLAERVGDYGGFNAVSGNYMNLGLQMGTATSWAGVLALCDRIEALSPDGMTLAFVHLSRVWIGAPRGLDTEAGTAIVERIVPDSTDPRAASFIPQVHAWRALAGGDWDAALTHVRAACEADPWAALWLADIAAIAGTRLRALDHLRRIADTADSLPSRTPWPTGRRALLRGAVAHLEGRPDEAFAAFDEARTTLRGVGSLIDVATATLAAATAFGDDRRVRAWEAEARTILEDLEAAALLARLDDAFAAAPSARPEPADVGAPARVETVAD